MSLVVAAIAASDSSTALVISSTLIEGISTNGYACFATQPGVAGTWMKPHSSASACDQPDAAPYTSSGCTDRSTANSIASLECRLREGEGDRFDRQCRYISGGPVSEDGIAAMLMADIVGDRKVEDIGGDALDSDHREAGREAQADPESGLIRSSASSTMSASLVVSTGRRKCELARKAFDCSSWSRTSRVGFSCRAAKARIR